MQHTTTKTKRMLFYFSATTTSSNQVEMYIYTNYQVFSTKLQCKEKILEYKYYNDSTNYPHNKNQLFTIQKYNKL